MKNKRGFTLIELLAVIVILAIIALIATPIILNMINEARKSAAKSSAFGYVDSIEAYTGFRALSEDTELEGYDVDLPAMTNGSVTCTKTSSGWNNECSEFFEAVDKKNKGKAPDEATIIISESGKVQANSKMTFNGYEINYDGTDAYIGKKTNNTSGGNSGNSSSSGSGSSTSQSTFGGTKVAATSTDTHKGIVYLNPTDLTVECTTSNSQIGTGEANASGCMKFYIYDDSGDNYKMILDHNTTATVAYEKSGTYKAYDQASIKTIVDSDTTGWASGLNPRLITANEIATITNTTTFDGSGSTWFYLDGTGTNKQTQASRSQGASPYAWLFDYTKKCTSYGCNTADSSTSGYWTSSPVSGNSIRAWRVFSYGYLYYGNVVNDNGYGVRPVITISKSKLQ